MIAEMLADPVALLEASPRPYRGRRILEPLTAGQEFSPEWDIDRAYDEALKKCAMVDRCTYGLSIKGASLPLMVMERAPGGATPAESHPLNDVLENPARDPVLGSREEVVARAFLHYQLAGNSLVGIVRAVDITQGGRRVPHLLKSEDPRQLFPVPDPVKKIKQWNYSDGDGSRMAWKREDLSHWKRHDPRNEIWGRSVLESLALNVDSAVEGSRTHLLRLARDGRPGMIIADENINDPEDGRDKERLLNARMRTARGGIMLLGGAQKLVAAGMSSSDLGILTSMAFDRDMIAIAFGYLPAGFSNEAATYANTGIFVLHEWSLVQAMMSSFLSRLSSFLFTNEERSRFFIAADYSEVQPLVDVTMEKLSMLKELAFKGIAMNALIRAIRLPIPEQKFGDVPLVPENVAPLAQILSQEM